MNDRDLRRVGKAEKALINSMARKVRKTRADQIRAMTDEEMARFLEKVGGCGPNFDLNYCDNRKTCDDLCWLDWLKQEATFNAETETTNCKDGGDAD